MDRGEACIFVMGVAFFWNLFLFPEQVALLSSLKAISIFIPRWQEACRQAPHHSCSRSLLLRRQCSMCLSLLWLLFITLHRKAKAPFSILCQRGREKSGPWIFNLGKAGTHYLNDLLNSGARPFWEGSRCHISSLAPDICTLSSLIISLDFHWVGYIRRLLSVHQITSLI